MTLKRGTAISRDFLYLLADRGLRLGVGVFLGGLIARHLGVEAYGWLSYAGAFMAAGAAVAQLGLDSILVREMARHPEQSAEMMGAALLLRAMIGALCTLAVLAAALLIDDGRPVERTLVRILALGCFVPAVGLPMLWFQARTESWRGVVAAFLAFVLVTGWRVWLLIENAPVAAFAWTSLVEGFVGGAFVGAWMFVCGGRFRFGSLGKCSGVLLRESWPLLVGGLAALLYMRMDQVMLNWLAGARAVGIYAAATRLSEIGYVVPVLMGTSVMASLSLAGRDEERFAADMRRYFQVSAAVGYLLALGGIIWGPTFLRLLFGEEFGGAGAVARVHILSVIFVSMSVARGRVLVARGWVRFGMTTALVGGAVNILLNLVLIPVWGAMGCAIASVVAHAMAGVGSTLLYPPTRELGWQQWRALVRPRWQGRFAV